MPRGPKAAKSIEDIFEVLKKTMVFDENGKLLSKSASVWKTASNKLGKCLNPHTLYLYVNSDRFELKTKLKKYYQEQPEYDKVSAAIDRASFLKNQVPERNFIEFDEVEWHDISPVQLENKVILKDGWTHIMFDKIYSKLRVRCPFTFENHYVAKDGTIKFSGYCTECGNKLTASSCASDSPKIKMFVIETCDTSKMPHFKKRQLSGPLRKKVQKELIHYKPTAFQRKEAKDTMEFGEGSGPLVHTQGVLRKCRQSAEFHEHRVRPAKNVVDELLDMTLQEEWSNKIECVTEFPISVVFSSKEQKQLWNCISKQEDFSVSIDAAGRFVKKIQTYSTDLSSHIFLYVASASVGGTIVPIFQFLSEYQSANFLSSILQSIHKDGLPKIKHVVTDGSKALQNAISMCYNQCSYKFYLNLCHSRLMGNDQLDFSQMCYIRCDIAHLIKTITRWKCFKNESNKKDFYTHVIGYMTTLTELSEVLEVAKNIYTVCQSPNIPDGSRVAESLQSLLNNIKFHKTKICKENCTCDTCIEPIMESYEYLDTDNEKSDEIDTNNIRNFFENMQKETFRLKCDEDADDNDYFCPGLAKHLTTLLCEYPAWTNVMMQTFNTKICVATSGRSEALFADLRNVTEMTRPVSMHLFIAKYYNKFLNGQVILAMASIVDGKISSATKILTTENNSAIKSTVKKRGKYLESCLDIENIHQRPKIKSLTRMLKNANLEPPILHEKKVYTFKTSCMFDTVFELCLSAFSNFINFHNDVINECSEKDCLLGEMMKYARTLDYRTLKMKRLLLCLTKFKNIQGELFCDFSLGDLILKFFSECNYGLFYIIINPKEENEILNIRTIENHINKNLKNEVIKTFVFVDIESYVKTTSIVMEEIPTKISLQNYDFLLAGFIDYTVSNYNDNLYHFTNYSRSVKNFWVRKDNLSKQPHYITLKNCFTVKISQLLYVKSF
ncbi:hypothetical protein TKK_0006587 [Trichogramma kaykai]|uniref:DUF659 domain-containing protein n=1 Tax=Trichogramma kaykai TaxID=54128 RepID=A0ABD2WW02_9HYME